MDHQHLVCPGCGKHCDLTAPQCSVGETFAKTGTLPLGGKHCRHKQDGCHDGSHGEGCRHSHHHEHGEGCGKHGWPEPERGDAGTPDALPTLEDRLIGNLHRLAHALRHGAESRGGQGKLLLLLYKTGGLTQHELMEMVDVRAGSLSEVLGKLEEGGYIERKQNEADRRRVDITLTDVGKQAAQAEETRVSEHRRGLFGTLNEAEQEQLVALLEKLSADWDVQGRDMHRHCGHERHGGGEHCGQSHHDEGDGCGHRHGCGEHDHHDHHEHHDHHDHEHRHHH